jgi:lysophospholipase L1-like esterase
MNEELTRTEKWALIIACILMAVTVAFADAKTLYVGVIGDSIEYSVFGGTQGAKLTSAPPKESSKIKKWIMSFVRDKRDAWSTGEKSYSITERLAQQGYKVRKHNSAYPGHDAEDAWYIQVPAIKKWAEKNGDLPDILIISLGENDVCADDESKMTPVSVYAAYMELIVKEFPKSKIYLLPVLRVTDLYDMLKDKRNVIGVKAPRVWKYMGYCKTGLKKDNKEAELRRIDYNTELKKISMKYKNVTFMEAMADYYFTSDSISKVDMFHPSQNGQREIANLVWTYF